MRGTPLIVVLGFLVASACARPDEDIRIRRVRAEGEALGASLDQLESRLLANKARVEFWTEMCLRHESVSAIACVSQDGHAEEIARWLERQPSRRAAVAGRSGSRVARAETGQPVLIRAR